MNNTICKDCQLLKKIKLSIDLIVKYRYNYFRHSRKGGISEVPVKKYID